MRRGRKDKGDNYIRAAALTMVPVAVFFLMLFWFILASREEDMSFKAEEIYKLEGEFTVQIGEESYNAYWEEEEIPQNVEVPVGETVTVRKVLSEWDFQNPALFIYGRQSWIRVSMEGEILWDYQEKNAFPMKMSPGTFVHVVELPEDFAGKELVLEVSSPLKKYSAIVPTIKIGNKPALLYSFLTDRLWDVAISFLTICIGISMIILSPLFREKRMIYMVCQLGVLAILTSIWSSLEYWMAQFVFKDMQVASFVLFSCYYLVPVFLASFLLAFIRKEKRKYIWPLFYLSIIINIGVHLCQILGITYYMETLLVGHGLIALLAAAGAGILLKDFIQEIRKKKGEKKINWVNLLWAMVFFCFVALDMLYFVLEGGFCGFVRIGFIGLGGYLLYYATKINNELVILQAREQIYAELAYQDMMTGLKNRTAFEERMDGLRENTEKAVEEKVILLIADMNNLKTLNDVHGHIEGDWAIIHLAKALKDKFSDRCECYRIGGDEYCVIASGMEMDEFTSFYREFICYVPTLVSPAGQVLSVSCGYCMVDEEGIDVCFKKADSLMYQVKQEGKIGIR